jgi:hypothetical protein
MFVLLIVHVSALLAAATSVGALGGPEPRVPSFAEAGGIGGQQQSSTSLAKRKGFPWAKLHRPNAPDRFHHPPPIVLAVPCRGGCNCTRAGPSRVFADCSGVFVGDHHRQQQMTTTLVLRSNNFPGDYVVDKLAVPRNVTNL